MSNFDPTNNYGGVSNYGSNPYGSGQSYGDSYGSTNPNLQAYQQQLNAWYQNAYSIYMSLQNGDPSKDIVARELQTAQSYAQESGFTLGDGGVSGNWDPLTGNGMGIPSGANASSNGNELGQVIWQDQTRIKYDGSDPVNYTLDLNNSESRQTDFFQNDVTIQIPYHGAVAKDPPMHLTGDDSVAPPAKMLVLTIDLPNGTKKTIVVHNFSKDTSHLHIENPDGDATAFPKDASLGDLASQVDVSVLGTNDSRTLDGMTEASVGGNPIQGEKQADGSLLYDVPTGQAIDFNPKGSGISGKEQIHDVYGDANITTRNTDTVEVTPNAQHHYDSNSQEDVIDKTDGYKITVTHHDGSKDTYIIHDGFKVNLNTRESTITWDDATVYDRHFAVLPTTYSKDAFPGITLNNPNGPTGESSSQTADGQPLSGKPEDMAPTSFSDDGETAYYDTYDSPGQRVDIHANFDDDVHTHDISATGPVHVHGTGSADTMKIVSYDANTHTWTIEVYKNGDTSQKETVIVHGGPDTQVILDVTDPSRVVESDDLKGSVQIGEGQPQNTNNAKADGVAEKLGSATGTDKALIEQEAEKAGFSLDAPPAVPTPELMAFLINIDPTLKQWLTDWKNTSDIGLQNQIVSEVRDEVVRLLKKIYPSTFNISTVSDSADGVQFGTDGNEGTYHIRLDAPTGYGNDYASSVDTEIYFFGSEGDTPPITTGTAAYHHDGY